MLPFTDHTRAIFPPVSSNAEYLPVDVALFSGLLEHFDESECNVHHHRALLFMNGLSGGRCSLPRIKSHCRVRKYAKGGEHCEATA